MNLLRALCAPHPRTRAAAVLLALAGGAAQALAASYAGSGIVANIGPPVGSVQSLLASSSGGYTLAGSGGWSLSAPFDFDFATGSGVGSFSLTRGADTLTGTLLTALGPPGSFALAYTVTGGTGQFAGASGDISSLVTLIEGVGPDAFSYAEIGVITVVPEPASWALMLGGAAWLAVRQRRRRVHG